MRLNSLGLFGSEVDEITIEAVESPGLPNINILGLPSESARQMRERIGVALLSSGFKLPLRKWTAQISSNRDIRLNRLPIELLDLPIATLILSAQIPTLFHRIATAEAQKAKIIALGSLHLNGHVCPSSARSVLIHYLEQSEHMGRVELFLAPFPESGQLQQTFPNDIFHAVDRLAWYTSMPESIEGRGSTRKIEGEFPATGKSSEPEDKKQSPSHPRLRRGTALILNRTAPQPLQTLAALCAIAGRHHCLFVGAPGTGKTSLAELIGKHQPSFSPSESVAQDLIQGQNRPRGRTNVRPFRKVRPSTSVQGLIGAASLMTPGECSLAHAGVLLLDEIAEFPRMTLEALRQPLDDREIIISGARGQCRFPSDFQLLATMNPCPCGYHFSSNRACHCTPTEVRKYFSRLSGPLLDRFHLLVCVDPSQNHESSKKFSEVLRQVGAEELLQRIIHIREQRTANPQTTDLPEERTAQPSEQKLGRRSSKRSILHDAQIQETLKHLVPEICAQDRKQIQRELTNFTAKVEESLQHL